MHREGHRRARPTAAVLLHPRRPPDGMKNTESEGTQHAGASPLPPLDITLACAGTSHPPHGSTLRTRSRDCRQGRRRSAPPLGTRIKPPDHRRGSKSTRCFPPCTSRRHRTRRPKMSPAPSFDDVPHRECSAMLKTPPRSAAGQVLTGCRCRKRRPSTLSRTALEIAEQHQAPQNAASSRTTAE